MIALLLGLVAALGGASDLARAERAYDEGRYAEAASLFEATLSEPGVAPGPVLYNLGNCAYRLGRYAEAVLYFRRAQLRLPRDAEVRFNLRLAQRQLGIAVAPEEPFAAAFLARIDALSPGALAGLVAALLSVGLVGLVLLRGRRAVRGVMVVSVLVALAGGARLAHARWLAGPPAGIVLARQVALRTEPHADLAITLVLEAGDEVRIAELSDRWARIVHPRGTGWTERGGLGLVD